MHGCSPVVRKQSRWSTARPISFPQQSHPPANSPCTCTKRGIVKTRQDRWENRDGGSWTKAFGKVGFAPTCIVLKASLASTYLTCHGDGSIILLWGVKEKKAVKNLDDIKEVWNDNWNYSRNGLKLLQVPWSKSEWWGMGRRGVN